eukprot:TRINITY_DN37162_c0_g1_i1.p1 TRINITY_DN37162_c0_g1~~TRINITY_DN37162_c0_g1_i1.p1  ORF type:complete len:1337 (-),score=302.64 TRINITY_DN37162_c0_g1_i1:54-3554(-)
MTGDKRTAGILSVDLSTPAHVVLIDTETYDFAWVLTRMEFEREMSRAEKPFPQLPPQEGGKEGLILLQERAMGSGTGETEGKGSEPWEQGSANDPERLNLVGLEMNYDQLVHDGHFHQAKTSVQPWADSYWPKFRDSINQRWKRQDCPDEEEPVTPNDLSPLEKYDVAFNGWTPTEEFLKLKPWRPCLCHSQYYLSRDATYYDLLGPAAKYWSDYRGNKQARDGVDNDQDGFIDDCDDNDGLGSWEGMCHAWCPAAILEPEPGTRVTHNNVDFDVSDIKSLLIMLYDENESKVLGNRCHTTSKNLQRDAFGRIIDPACRDTNPGAFHVILANLIGKQKRPFVVDRTFDFEVWNQPLFGYRVTDSQIVTSAEKALELLGRDSAVSYTFNQHAVKWVHVKLETDWITESHPSASPMLPHIEDFIRHDQYEYLVELDVHNNVVGGEWISTPPDFIWLPMGIPRNRNANPHVEHSMVQGLLDKSAIRYRTFSNAQRSPIPDNTVQGVESTIEIKEHFFVGQAIVYVDITHSYVGDLEIFLRHGDVDTTLFSREGGSRDDLQDHFNVSTTFGGIDVQGQWVLTVRDRSTRDEGVLNSWKIRFVETPFMAFSNDDENDIPDKDEGGLSSKIIVNNGFALEELQLTVDITHSYQGDLVVSLQHNGKEVVFQNREGGPLDDLQKTWTSTATDWGNALGEWILVVKDLARQDTGKLRSWQLKLKPTSYFRFTNPQSVLIPDNDPTGVSSEVQVLQDLKVGLCEVVVNISHSYRGDLVVELAHDDKVAALHTREGGTKNDLKEVFDCNSQFHDYEGIGKWTLTVKDMSRRDTGVLHDWTLRLGESQWRSWRQNKPIKIPDDDTTGIVSELTVPEDIRVQRAQVMVNVTHSYRQDLVVSVVHEGVKVTLHNRTGGRQDDLMRVFDLPQYVGMTALGKWSLSVRDVVDKDHGTLQDWAVRIVPALYAEYEAGAVEEAPSRVAGDEDSDVFASNMVTTCDFVFLDEVLPNADGSDHGKEFVELHNGADQAKDISGFWLEQRPNADEPWEKVHVFGSSTVLPAHKSVVVMDRGDRTVPPPEIPFSLLSSSTGCGVLKEDGDYTTTECSGLKLSNSGGSLRLKNSAGDTLDEVEWTTQVQPGVSLVRRYEGDCGSLWVTHPVIGGTGERISPGVKSDGSPW